MAKKRSGHRYAFKFAVGYRSYLGCIRFQTKPRSAGLSAIHHRLACGQNRMWKARSVSRLQSGAQLPRETLDGNSATFFRLKVEPGFPNRAKAETARHFLPINWGWVSQTTRSRRPHHNPALSPCPAISSASPIPKLIPARKKDARKDVLLQINWRRAGDSNPRCPFGAYSLSRRAPSASRSALRNSPFSVTKPHEQGKKDFQSSRKCKPAKIDLGKPCTELQPPPSMPAYFPASERFRAPSSSEPRVRHIW